MTDSATNTDGVLQGGTGALVATDLVSIDGNAATHIQYMKMGWGETGDTYYTVGTDTSLNSTSKPLPVQLRHSDGNALGYDADADALNVKVAAHGVTLHADVLHTLGALRVEGTAGQIPLHVMGSSASEPVIVQATGGTFSATNPQYTLPTMLFGLSGGNSAAPVGVTGTRLLVNHPENVTIISDGSGTFVSATGGFTLSSAAAATVLKTTPSVMFGVTLGGGISPVGITGQRLLVDVDGETIPVSQVLGGSSDAGGVKTQPTLIYGASGPSAAAIGVSGPANQPRLLVDLAGEKVAIDNANNAGLYIRATGGATATTLGEFNNLMPTLLYGVCGGTAAAVGVTNGKLDVHVGAACITLDVTLATTQKVLNATADAGNIHHRYLMVSGVTNNGHKPEEAQPLFVSGKSDGSTYAYPIGITTSMVGASGGAWPLHVTADNIRVTAFTPTVTVSATDLDIRGLLGTGAPGAKDLVEVVGGSGDGPVFVRATGGLGHRNIPVHNTMPSMLYGITGAASASGGLSAGAVGITGADMLHVGIGHPVAIDASATNPLRVQATGGLSASSGNNARLPLDVTVPSLLMGLSAGADTRGAPIGMSADMLRIDIAQGISAGRDSMLIYPASGITSQGAGSRVRRETDLIPTLLMGASVGGAGWSAAAVGMSGDAINVNMINAGITVDVTVGTSVEVSNDTGGPLYIAGASGASGAGALLPVTVAGDFNGNAVNIGGSAGMVGVEVRGSSSGTYWAVGVTGNANYSLATDENLNLLGKTLDNLYTLIENGLGGPSDVAKAKEKFSTYDQMQQMAPAGAASVYKIANEKEQKEMEIHLGNISSAYGPTAETEISVAIKSFPQPTQFVGGQKTCTGSSTQLASDQGLSSGVKLKGHQNNSNFVYVGVSGVNVDTGYPLGPSEEVFLEIDNINKVFVMSTPAGQTACFIAS